MHYNLEAILAVGYGCRSHRGTQFRQWATARLQEYLVKGFVMDDERLKNPARARPRELLRTTGVRSVNHIFSAGPVAWDDVRGPLVR